MRCRVRRNAGGAVDRNATGGEEARLVHGPEGPGDPAVGAGLRRRLTEDSEGALGGDRRCPTVVVLEAFAVAGAGVEGDLDDPTPNDHQQLLGEVDLDAVQLEPADCTYFRQTAVPQGLVDVTGAGSSVGLLQRVRRLLGQASEATVGGAEPIARGRQHSLVVKDTSTGRPELHDDGRRFCGFGRRQRGAAREEAASGSENEGASAQVDGHGCPLQKWNSSDGHAAQGGVTTHLAPCTPPCANLWRDRDQVWISTPAPSSRWPTVRWRADGPGLAW